MIALSKKPDYEGENLEINEKEGKRKMLIETESCSIKKKQKKETNPTTATRTSQIQPKLENILRNFFLPSVSFSLLSWLCALDQVDEMPRGVVCQPYRPMGVGAEGAFPH